MTKTEYMTAIETSLTTAEALCADLRKLRNLKKLAQEISGSEAMVSFDLLDKAVEDKEAALKATRAELGKARRIVKKFEEIEGMEAEGDPVQEKTAPTKKSRAKKPAAENPETAPAAEGTAA